MGSYFPGMVKPAAGRSYDVYVLHVGDNGNYILQSLGADGTTESFAAGDDVGDMLCDLATELSPNAEFRLNPENEFLVGSVSGDLVDTWAKLAGVLNDKAHPDHPVVKACFYRSDWATDRYIEMPDREWVLTDLGRAFDAKYFPAV